MTRALLLAFALTLSACDDQAAAPTDDGAGASGEVLKGSVSDAMIPFDELDSQGPLAPRQTVPTGDVDAAQPEVTPVPGVDAAPAPAPAAQPAPAPAAETQE